MKYKALVTVDLPEAYGYERQQFNEALEAQRWIKLSNLDTAWKIQFSDQKSRDEAIRIIKNDLKAAKSDSGISQVFYALQLNQNDLDIGSL